MFAHLFAQCAQIISSGGALPASLFLAGLLGGVTHCAGMCGPFVIAQGRGLEKTSGLLLLPYHLGRMTTYVTMAVLFSTILNLAFLFSPSRALIAAPLLVMAALLFLISAFPALQTIFPWAGRVSWRLPKMWHSLLQKVQTHAATGAGQYFMGLLLGFMPCGLVAAALMASATASSPAASALAMMAFSLGTIPALIAVSLGGKVILRKFPERFALIQRGAMVISALWLVVLAGYMVL